MVKSVVQLKLHWIIFRIRYWQTLIQVSNVCVCLHVFTEKEAITIKMQVKCKSPDNRREEIGAEMITDEWVCWVSWEARRPADCHLPHSWPTPHSWLSRWLRCRADRCTTDPSATRLSGLLKVLHLPQLNLRQGSNHS